MSDSLYEISEPTKLLAIEYVFPTQTNLDLETESTRRLTPITKKGYFIVTWICPQEN